MRRTNADIGDYGRPENRFAGEHSVELTASPLG